MKIYPCGSYYLNNKTCYNRNKQSFGEGVGDTDFAFNDPRMQNVLKLGDNSITEDEGLGGMFKALGQVASGFLFKDKVPDKPINHDKIPKELNQEFDKAVQNLQRILEKRKAEILEEKNSLLADDITTETDPSEDISETDLDESYESDDEI